MTGAGFETLRPLPITRQFLITNDIELARQIAGHNITCASQPGCAK